jgi:hypothetical protein
MNIPLEKLKNYWKRSYTLTKENLIEKLLKEILHIIFAV